MQFHEGLEFKGPAPVSAFIKEHPLLQDGFKGHKRELYSLSAFILGKAIDNWMTFHPGLTKTQSMTIAEARGLFDEPEGTDRGLDYYVPMEADEVFDGYSVEEAIGSGIKHSIEWSLDELTEDWGTREKGAKASGIQSTYDRFLYLTSQLGIDAREFLTNGFDQKIEMMIKVAKIIAIAHIENTGEEISPEEFAQISHASFPLIERLSKVKMENGRPKFIDKAFGGWDKFLGWQNDPPANYFEIVKKDGQLQLDLSVLGQLVYEQDRESDNNIVGWHDFVRVGDSSPAEKLWPWLIDFIKDEEILEGLVRWDTVDRIKQTKDQVKSSRQTV